MIHTAKHPESLNVQVDVDTHVYKHQYQILSAYISNLSMGMINFNHATNASYRLHF